MKNSIFVIFLIGIIGFQSCTKPVDFDQIDDAEIKANYIITQVYFDLGAKDFLDDDGNEISLINNLIQVPIDNSSQKYVEEIQFTFVTQNTFDRDFNVNIVLFDSSLEPIYIIQPTIYIPANSGETTTTIIIPKEDVNKIFSAEFFNFTIRLASNGNGSDISIEDASKLNFKSYVELFLNYTTE